MESSNTRKNDKRNSMQIEYAYLAALVDLSPEIKHNIAAIINCKTDSFNGMVSKFSNRFKGKENVLTQLEEEVWKQFARNPISTEQAKQKILNDFEDKIHKISNYFKEQELKKIYSFTDERYEGILKRVFKRSARELFFKNYFLNIVSIDKMKLSTSEMLDPASISMSVREDLIHFYKDMAKVRVLNSLYEHWYRTNTKHYNEIFNEYRACLESGKEIATVLSRSEFRIFFEKEEDFRCCSFCDISEDQIKALSEIDQIQTKRFYSRGKTMEVDQLNAYQGYTKDNITLCCYWCNNAKTDEFSEEEFREFIAPGMKKIWQKRLSLISIKKAA